MGSAGSDGRVPIGSEGTVPAGSDGTGPTGLDGTRVTGSGGTGPTTPHSTQVTASADPDGGARARGGFDVKVELPLDVEDARPLGAADFRSDADVYVGR
ncbi:hypothetical protein ACF09Y_10230 [Streptomyces massasporeus]|uniref:hypothetical protein n=1 Tax=Streptomyces massasporeus TaxID=67324 RepID=UPI0036F4E547